MFMAKQRPIVWCVNSFLRVCFKKRKLKAALSWIRRTWSMWGQKPFFLFLACSQLIIFEWDWGTVQPKENSDCTISSLLLFSQQQKTWSRRFRKDCHLGFWDCSFSTKMCSECKQDRHFTCNRDTPLLNFIFCWFFFRPCSSLPSLLDLQAHWPSRTAGWTWQLVDFQPPLYIVAILMI